LKDPNNGLAVARYDDWARFDFYAPLVRSLVVNAIVPPGAFYDQAQIRQKVPLLRNLRLLRWTAHARSDNEDIRAFCSFLSPTLVSLDLDLDSLWANCEPILFSSLRDILPHLEELALRGDLRVRFSPGNSGSTSIIGSLEAASSLRKLHIDQRSFVLMGQDHPILGQLESLDLGAYSRWSESDTFTEFVPPTGRWPRLQVLSACYGGREGCSFFQNILPPAGQLIRSIKLVVAYAHMLTNKSEHISLFSAIGRNCPSLESLTAINIAFADLATSLPISGLLSPLYNCSRLCELRVSCEYIVDDISFTVSDDDIFDMTSAFKNLQILQMESREINFVPIPHPTLTLAAIGILAEHSSSLHSVTLTTDATLIPIIQKGPGNRDLASGSIRNLNFGHSLIDNPKDVANYLYNIGLARDVAIASGEYEGDLDEFRETAERLAQGKATWRRVTEIVKLMQ
jgi:hypothetical protein